MITATRENLPRTLELPDPFEDLTGILAADLKVIVTALSQRAGERMLLSSRQRQQLERKLWDNLTQVINETLEPLSVERH